MGIEPTSEAWEASILPLYDARSDYVLPRLYPNSARKVFAIFLYTARRFRRRPAAQDPPTSGGALRPFRSPNAISP
jgi:hypothetical protein